MFSKQGSIAGTITETLDYRHKLITFRPILLLAWDKSQTDRGHRRRRG